MCYGDNAPKIKHLATRLLSHIASSFAADRNWSTYTFIHYSNRKKLTSRRAHKLVATHSSLRLANRKTPDYQMGTMKQWDVNPKVDAPIDEEDGPNEMRHGLVGVSLVTDECDSNSDSDTSIDALDAFMLQMDVEDQSMEHTPLCLFDHDVDSFQLFFIVSVLTLDSRY